MGCEFVGAYGLTETTGGGTILRAEHHDPGGPNAHLLRSAGQPWADIELRIVDPETFEDLGEGEVGEIWLKSAVTLKGYWGDPGVTAEVYPKRVTRMGSAGFGLVMPDTCQKDFCLFTIVLRT